MAHINKSPKIPLPSSSEFRAPTPPFLPPPTKPHLPLISPTVSCTHPHFDFDHSSPPHHSHSPLNPAQNPRLVVVVVGWGTAPRPASPAAGAGAGAGTPWRCAATGSGSSRRRRTVGSRWPGARGVRGGAAVGRRRGGRVRRAHTAPAPILITLPTPTGSPRVPAPPRACGARLGGAGGGGGGGEGGGG